MKRMHTSRMRTARNSNRLLEGVSASVMLGSPLGVGLETPPQMWTWRPPGQIPQLPPGWGPGDPPQARPLNFPPGCGPGDPAPRPDPSTSPLSVGLETSPPPGQTPQTPWVWAWRPAMHAGIPPPAPREKNHRHL